jgi:hypothetical protein
VGCHLRAAAAAGVCLVLAHVGKILATFYPPAGVDPKKIADFFKFPLVNWKKSSYNKV